MDYQEYIERNIKKVLSVDDRPERPTPTMVQRVCGVGYNQAMHTLCEMERRSIVKRQEADTFKFDWVI